MRRRPNILLITTDQQRADHLGLKGLQAVGTPNLDRLGREGVHFDRAYCPSPICTPTRVSLLTGLYPSSHGAYSIGVTVPEFPRPTLPEILKEAGYRSALIGKSHFVSRRDEERHMAGSEDVLDGDFFRNWRGPYLGFDEFEGSTGHTINNSPAQHYRLFLEESGEDWEKWFPLGRPEYDHDACGPWDIPDSFHDTEWVTRRTEAFIRKQEAAVPWFCWASYQDPHEPFVCPEPWYSQVDTRKMEIPTGYREGEFADRHPVYLAAYRRELDRWQEGHGIPSVYGSARRTAASEAAMQATLGMVSFIDDRVGRLLRTLESGGQLDDTIVVFTSDHGEMHGHHGLWGKGATAYEDCQRVPLLIWNPSRIAQRGTVEALANLVDLPATLLSLAGLEVPAGMQGKDLSPVLKGEAETIQDATLIECRPTTSTLYQQTLVTQRHKLVVYRDEAAGELYDLEGDPRQLNNLWDNPRWAELKSDLLIRFARFQMEREGRVTPRVGFG